MKGFRVAAALALIALAKAGQYGRQHRGQHPTDCDFQSDCQNDFGGADEINCDYKKYSTSRANPPTPSAGGNSTHCDTEFVPGGMTLVKLILKRPSAPRTSNSLTDIWCSEIQKYNVDDGIAIEAKIGLDMAWSQFEFDVDADVKINYLDNASLGGPSDVIIRPTSIKYSIRSASDGSIIIRVPASENGAKFSVEFKDNLYTFCSNGTNYVEAGGEVVGVEPLNALIIFASPFILSDKVPPLNGPITKVIAPGPINVGGWGSSPILYFPPGAYWMNTNWDGVQGPLYTWAYVKAAVEYSTGSKFYATGHGVLSGEHYVYQANPTTYYQGLKSDQYSLRMWVHYNLTGDQTWYCVEPTITAPPLIPWTSTAATISQPVFRTTSKWEHSPDRGWPVPPFGRHIMILSFRWAGERGTSKGLSTH
ncbi:uncharacterized protein DFL_003151 [Arthrobotrys flagrans]|uniref:Glycoside hydrolase family 49 N-terminal domain-containing protein n=1 Tax=Arthrobotrys flagrans TaxID=97331 RepID=A0A437A168_ARTFL|nr:hypothetical protein DFL_003151 [Arthrobotrys flagrans]